MNRAAFGELTPSTNKWPGSFLSGGMARIRDRNVACGNGFARFARIRLPAGR